MSWYGDHPTSTKEQAKQIAPKRACRLCIYRTRVFGVPVWNFTCSRCGIEPSKSLARPYLEEVRERLTRRSA